MGDVTQILDVFVTEVKMQKTGQSLTPCTLELTNFAL